MVFQFEVVELDNADGGLTEGANPLAYRQWKLPELKSIIDKWQNFGRAEGFWNACVSFLSLVPQTSRADGDLCCPGCSLRIMTRHGLSHAMRTTRPLGARARRLYSRSCRRPSPVRCMSIRVKKSAWQIFRLIGRWQSTRTLRHKTTGAGVSRGRLRYAWVTDGCTRILQQRTEEAAGKEVDMSDVLYGCQRKARDHARTPMQVSRSGLLDSVWLR